MTVAEASSFEPYRFRTRNVREGENKVHSPKEAQERGFQGSIVGGATVYGQMIHPLVERYGLDWLGSSWLEIRFKRPAYDGDLVETRFDSEDDAEGGVAGSSIRLRTYNADGTELLEMRAHLVTDFPEPDPRIGLDPIEWEGDRVEGTFERMVLDRPFRTLHWKLSLEEQIGYCRATEDELSIYCEGTNPPAHPGLIMSQGSHVVQNQFVMPFWIHGSSTLLIRRAIRVGDAVEQRCVPYEKWKRGDNEWVKFYQLYLVEGEPAIEVWKTSLIKVAQR